MKLKFENPTPMPRNQLENALLSDDGKTVAGALIAMAFWERDYGWAERKSLEALVDGRKEVRTAALLSIAHLARLHKSLNLDVVIPEVRKLLSDPDCRGTAEDSLDDIAIFMPEGDT